MGKLRVGVVGAGHLGAFHAKMYSSLEKSSGMVFAGVCDKKKTRARDIANKYTTRFFHDYRKMVGEVDAVSIVVPTSLHYQVAKFFLESGVHVLIEKPITKTLEEADELIEIARKRDLVIQVGHIERFNSAVLAIEPYLDKPKFVECQRLGSIKKKGRIKDVGVVLDLMIHDIDIILSLIQSKVKYIEAFGQSTVSDHEDVANVRLTFQNNAIADITASRVTKEEVRKLRIFQEHSYILLDYMHHDAVLYKTTAFGLEKIKIRIRRRDALKVELKSFINCVKNGKKPIVSGVEGRQALKVALDILARIHGS
ncbi:MAG: Gfo/Idh/MocA family oxidoreductase [Candidatus Omnitrophica bacterium]|nr:Gfo/Idh/MocA family oxidoreductase [Candidatus Omnitrophota bacterium]